ncbi:MAG: hypothetical protein ACAH88_10930, partial [Roseimicrobium sp.]
MRTIFVLLLLGVTGCAAYLYAYDPVIEMVGLRRDSPPASSSGQAPTLVKVPEPPPLPAPPTSATSPVVEMTAPVVPAPTPAPVSPQVPQAPAMADNTPKPDADGFVLPTFLPLEDVVKNWTQIPVTAFPRQARVMKPVEFVTTLSGGNRLSSKVPAGSAVQVLGQEGGMLTIALSDTSPAKAQIAIDDTDLKAVLTEAYEQWKIASTERARRAHLFAEAATKRAANTPATSAGAPVRNAEGTYDILLASMKAGQVLDLTPLNVRKWGDPVQEEIDGQKYWTIMVDATVQTMFGPLDAQAVAYIRDG